MHSVDHEGLGRTDPTEPFGLEAGEDAIKGRRQADWASTRQASTSSRGCAASRREQHIPRPHYVVLIDFPGVIHNGDSGFP